MAIDIQSLKEMIEPEILCDFLGLDYKEKNGRLYVLCPFHGDRSLGSAFIKDGWFYCFSCGESMDLITLTERVKGVGFYSTIKLLGSLFGVSIDFRANNYGDEYYRYHLNKEELEVMDFPKTSISLRKVYNASPDIYKEIVLKRAKEKKVHYQYILEQYADRTSEKAYKIVELYSGVKDFNPQIFRDLAHEAKRRIRVCDMIIERLE